MPSISEQSKHTINQVGIGLQLLAFFFTAPKLFGEGGIGGLIKLLSWAIAFVLTFATGTLLAYQFMGPNEASQGQSALLFSVLVAVAVLLALTKLLAGGDLKGLIERPKWLSWCLLTFGAGAAFEPWLSKLIKIKATAFTFGSLVVALVALLFAWAMMYVERHKVNELGALKISAFLFALGAALQFCAA